MVDANLPFTFVITKPSGKRYWRFRRGGITGALPGEPGDTAFHDRYSELLALAEKVSAGKPAPATGSMSELIRAYRGSAEFGALRDATRDDYGATLDLVDAELGKYPYRLITTAMVKRVRDDLRATPRKAHKVKQMVSRLYSWAQEESLVKPGMNPAAGFKRLKVRQNTIMPWSDYEITLFLGAAPAHLQRAIRLLLYTGQRCEDVVNMTWELYQRDFIRVRQSKTGEPMDIACHAELRADLDAVKVRRGLILRNAKGRPYNANSLRKAISDQCAAIDGMPNRSPHGLRYAAAGTLEEAGATVAEIVAVLGHRTYQMAIKYLSARRQSASGMSKLERRA